MQPEPFCCQDHPFFHNMAKSFPSHSFPNSAQQTPYCSALYVSCPCALCVNEFALRSNLMALHAHVHHQGTPPHFLDHLHCHFSLASSSLSKWLSASSPAQNSVKLKNKHHFSFICTGKMLTANAHYELIVHKGTPVKGVSWCLQTDRGWS